MKNTLGTPQPLDYLLGRGEIFFSLIDSTTLLPTGGFQHLGNAPAFTATVSSDTLTHTSSMQGLATIDAEVTTAQNMNLSFQLEEFNDDNLSRFFAGETASFTNGAVAGFTSYSMIPAGKVTPGRWYELKKSDGTRLYDVESGNITVTINSVACVEGTDYTLNKDMGLIFLVSTSTKVQGAVTSSYPVVIAAAADSGARNVDEVRGQTQSTISGALKFIGKNPRRADKMSEFDFHLVNLTADGDLSLIGTDWSKLPFKGAAQKNSTAYPLSPTLTIRSLV